MPRQLNVNVNRDIEESIPILKKGGVVAFPTDTVYGLGACADNYHAVERIYLIKKRPRNMALPLLLAEAGQLTGVSSHVPDIVWSLVDNFWPGALTLVLPVADSVLDIVTAGGKTIAVRVPDHPVPIAMIKGLKIPLVGTSANLSSMPSPLNATEVYSQLGDNVDFIIDGGQCAGSNESTIIDVTGERPVILRQGAISSKEIRRVCPNIILKESN